jgi:hypothetical protein
VYHSPPAAVRRCLRTCIVAPWRSSRQKPVMPSEFLPSHRWRKVGDVGLQSRRSAMMSIVFHAVCCRSYDGIAAPASGAGARRSRRSRGCGRSQDCSALVKSHDRRFCQRIEVEMESNDCCRGVGLHGQTVGAHCEHREKIAVGMIAGWRARSPITRRAEVRAGLERATW